MALAQLSLELSKHNNRFLFSDHYLDEVLKRSPIWRDSLDEGMAFFEWLKALYAKEKDQLPRYKETQLEEHWFDPILEKLGHTFETQASIPSLRGTGMKYPDYVFFPDEAVRQEAIAAQNTEDYTRGALAVGEMKKWDTPLSKKIKGGTPSFENNNPSYQIDYYLRATNLGWGLLTNGNRWRLVHRDTSYKLDVYFEIDLEKAIVNEWKAAILFFYLFFRQAAFKPDAQDQIFLEEALKDSRAYAVQLETDLSDNAYKALEQLITGFFEPPQNKLDPQNPAHLKTVYDNSLYLLYRILFLFYGENRGLLPMHNENYRSYSLTGLAKKVATQIDRFKKIPPMTNLHWHHLQTLFRIISGEDPSLNDYLQVPRYNGGLFNPELHPFLEQHFVGDRHLAYAIDYLSRRTVTEGGKFAGRERVDYRTLGVRQLGSIYEGLLEYQPRQATEPMVAVRKGKVERWVTAAEKKVREKALEKRGAGEMYLATDKGERKTSGSYYTPDYIVKYIVENTLDPLIEAARQIADGKQVTVTSRAQRFVDQVLALNILDPAMGSGHFLVEATDHLARALAADPWVTTTDDAQDEDLVYWRRQVVEHCIYGVDKNRLAVELAKLSLWLVTAAQDKPLSFLDHHLRHGDSLVGARLADLHTLPRGTLPSGKKTRTPEGQIELFDPAAFTRDAGLAVGGMLTIQSLPSERIEDIHAKEETLQELQHTHLEKWQHSADLWVSAFFGNEMQPEEYAALVRHLQGQRELPENITQQHLEHPAYAENDYFHWELAFPEIFFDRHGNPKREQAGFDAVIGNPPYVRQEVIKAYKPFFGQHFSEVYAGTADLFVYFFSQAIQLLQTGGLTSYISSNSWLRANYATALRVYLRENTTIEQIIDLGDNRIFEDATDVYPAIHIVRKQKPVETYSAKAAVFSRGEGIDNFAQQIAAKHFRVRINDQPNEGWQLEKQEYRELSQKILSTGIHLHKYSNGEIYYGIKTGLNDAFILIQDIHDQIVQADPKSKSLLKTFLSGADARPWYWENKHEWLLAIPNGWTEEKTDKQFSNEDQAWVWFAQSFPSIANHLKKFEERAKKRADQGKYWWELRPCNYWDDFDGWKIFYPEMSKYPRFVMAEPGIVGNKTTFMIPLEDYFLLGVLMSRVNWFAIQNLCQPIGERAGMLRYTLSTQFMKHLPIPVAEEQDRELLAELAKNISSTGKSRHTLHAQTRHRIHTDLGTPEGKLNQKLTAWWNLDFPAFRAEIKKAFKRDIPLRERDDWEAYLKDRRAKHAALTAQIIRLETELNAIVYRLFDLDEAEIEIIEKSTKYPYGEV